MKSNPAHQKLLSALSTLKTMQDAGKIAIRSADLDRAHRESLVKNGFLRLIVKGWYMPARPGERDGSTTSWYASMLDFIKGYCTLRFKNNWYVSPEYSLFLYASKTTLPRQLVVHTPVGKNSLLNLPDQCSIFDYKAKCHIPSEKIHTIDGVRVLSLPLALTRISESFYANYAQDAQIVLLQLRDASDINRELLDGGHSVVAGRLAGALRAVGREDLANDVLATMRAAGFVVAESNPFLIRPPALTYTRIQSPYVLRIKLMWQTMREIVLDCFPIEPGMPSDVEDFMTAVEEKYQTDAYHSLSIEGYKVTDELIRKVATGDWNPDAETMDKDAQNAIAAHGYWLAHNAVKDTIRAILAGKNAGRAYTDDHSTWHRALFTPNVDAGILKPVDLAGYRSDKVFIRNAMHVPPSQEAVRDMMPELCNLLESEPSAAVRAVLGHFMFVYIHPYFDGNGRLGRFLMNAMLASGGYPWTIVKLENRQQYLEALEEASSRGEIRMFAKFIATMTEDGLFQ